MLEIRRADAGDAYALSLLGSATMLETYADNVPGPDIVTHCANKHSAAVYAHWLADPAVAIWTVRTPTQAAIGYLVMTPATLPSAAPHPDDLEVQRIYVLSRFHGLGLGHRLMNHAVAEAGARSGRQLVLGVLKVNARAVAFYQRQGFVHIDTRSFQVGASIFDDYVLGRPLRDTIVEQHAKSR